MADLNGVPEIDETQSPLFQAFKRMQDNLPPYPIALLEGIGLRANDDWAKSSVPNFRGWFGGIGGRYDIQNFMAIPNGVDLDDIGYVGIWQARTAGPIVWCAIPSMEHGESKPGDSFDVGKASIRIGWMQEDLDTMVMDGYRIIMQMIAERGEYQEDIQDSSEPIIESASTKKSAIPTNAQLSKKVVYYFNSASGEIRMGRPENFPAPFGFQKIVCTSAHAAEQWSERLRRYNYFREGIKDEERAMIEGAWRAELRSHIHHLMANSRNNFNKDAMRHYLEKHFDRDKSKTVREEYNHAEGYEQGR